MSDPLILELVTGGAAINAETGQVTVHGVARCPDGPECPEHGQVVRMRVTEIVAGALDIVPDAIVGTFAITFDEGRSVAFGVSGRRRTVAIEVYRGEFERAKRWYGRLLEAIARSGNPMILPWESS